MEANEAINARLQALTGHEGVFVLGVRPGSPAAKAGLVGAIVGASGIVPGDILTSVDKDPVKSLGELLAKLDEHRAGDKISVTVVRKNLARTLSITLQGGG